MRWTRWREDSTTFAREVNFPRRAREMAEMRDGCMQSCPPRLDLGRGGDGDKKKIKKEENFLELSASGPLSLIKGGLDSMPGPDWSANK